MQSSLLSVVGMAALSSCLLGQSSTVAEKIAWFSTLDSARAEAKRSGKPIFMIAARPECRGVPGFW